MKSIEFLKPTRLDDLVRIGRNFDGGYLVNQRVLGQTKVLIGLGIDRDWSFEEQFQSLNPNVSVWCFDGSVSGTGTKADRFRIFVTQKIPLILRAIVRRNHIYTILHIIKVYREINRLFPQFKEFFSKPKNHFFSLFISSRKKSNHISPSGIIEKISITHPLTPNSCFLKMDIEGYEFSVLTEFLIHNTLINSMVVEFHDLDFRWDSFSELIEKIKEQFVISHVHDIQIKDIFRKVRQVELRTRGLVNNIFGGEYHSAFKGKGMTFSEVRAYQYGDDVRAIDWNVSARRDETYVKIFEEEREQSLMILFDASASGDFGSGSEFKRELGAMICATLAFSAIKNNDKVGLVIFTNEIEKVILPKKGRSHVLRILREIFFFEPNNLKTDLGKVCEFAIRILKRRSIVLLVSDLISENYEDKLRFLKQKHDCVVIHINDKSEQKLPKSLGYITLRDLETGETITVDSSDKKFLNEFSAFSQELATQRKTQLKKRKIDVVTMETDKSFIEPLTLFFKNRNKL
ncbi:hypothetical protein CHS0354_000751 [Potamilus streckersoni]|uniref:VWFA domain-containing protein n=1 Tax=Potamilus streckersoni TaxID=2493646 RepID=A0AAE0W9E3_9BIVA|nr:hypothetical protein CHS0354_000751 [Potamilus streckersoni]